MTLLDFHSNVEAFTKARTLNQLRALIEAHIEEFNVHLVGNNCLHLVLLTKDDRYFIEVSVDMLNPHSNKIAIFDRKINRDFSNKDLIANRGLREFKDYLFALKQQHWAQAR